ncbi:polysaccharide deacetylase family protein [Macellibacteroides fermentans]|uniref:polysaccharide deacetylase family protein n=1 Tax=Macellibacteroides fermentans TaxID=879969 RepID=UPI003B92AD30
MKIVLMYHDVYDKVITESGFQNPSALQYKISAKEFESQISSIRNYCDCHPETEVELTFDDGGVSFLTIIAPILEKYGFKGIFFIATKYLDTPLFLTSNQLMELSNRGHIIGSHSHTHAELSSLAKNQIDAEWNDSVKIIKKYCCGTVIASIPNGAINKNVIKSALANGINMLYTSSTTTSTTCLGSMEIVGRYVVYQGMSVNDVLAIISSKTRRQIMYIKWLILKIVKYFLGNHYNSTKAKLFKK